MKLVNLIIVLLCWSQLGLSQSKVGAAVGQNQQTGFYEKCLTIPVSGGDSLVPVLVSFTTSGLKFYDEGFNPIDTTGLGVSDVSDCPFFKIPECCDSTTLSIPFVTHSLSSNGLSCYEIGEDYLLKVDCPDNYTGCPCSSVDALRCIVPGANDSWQNETGCVNTGAGSFVTSGSGCNNGWNNGAGNATGISPDMELCFELGAASGNSPLMVGLDCTDPNAHYNTIDYAFYFYDNGGCCSRVYIFENGAYQGLFANSTYGSFNGDEFCIRVSGGTVDYLHNGTSLYSHTISTTCDLRFDSSAYQNNGFWSGNRPVVNIELCEL